MSTDRTPIELRYAAPSTLAEEADVARLALMTTLDRAEVGLTGVVRDPVRLREALSALHAIVSSDLRYKPKDRTAYLAFQRQRRQASGQSTAAAQRAWFDWLARNDPTAWLLLDPLVSVHADGVIFEVFSKDEGTYAQLFVDRSALDLDEEPRSGTTNIDFSKDLFEAVQRMRSYRTTRLDIGPAALAVSTDDAEVVEKKTTVPDSWLRGLLQVQSAAALTRTTVGLAPIDLYNLLRQLRLNADVKREGRAIRFELVPGETPRLVLEPWETVLECGAAPYAGRKAEIVKVWGRRRLMLLRRWLPFVEQVDVHLMGSGLPTFWVLRSGPFALTLGLTGFTSSDWGRALALDVLLPREPETGEDAARALVHLAESPDATPTALGEALGWKAPRVLAALQAACRDGLAIKDLATGRVRIRPLTERPIDLGRLQHRNPTERVARDLVATKDAVKISKEDLVHGVGLEVTGRVTVAAEKREYRPQVLLDGEGRVRKADCTCAGFRKHRLKEGPCAHLVALRLAHAAREKRRAERRGKSRGTVRTETRSYGRRHAGGESVFQVTLDNKKLRIRWGERSDPRLRVQNLLFDSVADARAAYFDRVDRLERDGYLDATA